MAQYKYLCSVKKISSKNDTTYIINNNKIPKEHININGTRVYVNYIYYNKVLRKLDNKERHRKGTKTIDNRQYIYKCSANQLIDYSPKSYKFFKSYLPKSQTKIIGDKVYISKDLEKHINNTKAYN